MKRTAKASLSPSGEQALTIYERWMQEHEDLTAASIGNYLSDVRSFVSWYESQKIPPGDENHPISRFDPQAMTTPTLTRSRPFL
jgi:hypothetical protein